ncbi:solute carrier family 13 member 1 [Alosa sapidissima]|uniref:solute carrier family 13 member 1 n=1 Tax=Alosa sapidissima TaxID=34773 RepID=UPI001C0A592F|nr:solute carrier family 13 member 1 [Alosa sapidissima]
MRGQGIWIYRHLILIILTPLLLLPIPLIYNTKVAECAFTLLLMGVYWLTEALPVSITALIPAMLFPLFGIMKSSQVAAVFFKDFHLLLTGVICLATAIEKWGLHRRIALGLISIVGVNPGRLMFGSMVGCAFLSMWLSNTSAVAMVMPIVEAVLKQIVTAEGEARELRKRALTGTSNLGLQLDEMDRQDEKAKENMSVDPSVEKVDITIEKSIPDNQGSPCDSEAQCTPSQGYYRTRQDHLMCKGLSLCIAYSASIGGMTALTGSSTNMIFAEYMHQLYPDCNSINFGNWFIFCLPISFISLFLSWIWLHWLYLGSDFRSVLHSKAGNNERETAVAKVLQEEYKALGPISRQEIISLAIFSMMVLLWFTRKPGFMPGWSSLFPDHPGYATDATVALLMGLLFFIIPAQVSTDNYETLITWKDFQSCMPWEICLLVGGGFALAEGTQASGLSYWMAKLLVPLGVLPKIATITIVCVIVTCVTEVASNSATITIFLPILAPLAESIHVNPLYMLIPATLSVSFSFLLPSANPPNAIVFSYGHLTTWDMIKAGVGVNVISVLGLLLGTSTWGIPLFNLDIYPDWATNHPMTNSSIIPH